MPKGPAPKPTALKLLQGNPGHQTLNKLEPKLKPAAPELPSDLNAEALKRWKFYVPLLLKARMVAALDGGGLAAICRNEAMIAVCQREIKKQGLFITSKRSGVVRVNAAAQKLEALQDQNRKLAQEYGMTPSARTRLQVPPVVEDNPWLEYDA